LPSRKSSPAASELHESFVSTYEDECEGDWALGPNDGYYFQFLLDHMISARGIDAGFRIFSDLDWLLSKWRAAGARSMLADCRYFPDRPLASAISTVVTNGSNDVDLEGLASALKTPRSTSRYAFSNNGPQKYFLVAGTGTMRLGNALVFASETIGLELARTGLGLISGGWQGVDHIVCREYVNQLRRDQLPSKGRLIHVIPQGAKPDLWNLEGFAQEGDLEFANDSSAASRRSVERANALVLIGGAGGTFDIYEDAMRLGKPVYPIPGTGGDAGRAYRQAIQINPGLQSIERTIRDKRDAREIALAITELDLTASRHQADPSGQRDEEISGSEEDFESYSSSKTRLESDTDEIEAKTDPDLRSRELESEKRQDIDSDRQPSRASSREVPAQETRKSANSSSKRKSKAASKTKVSKLTKKK
jgi:hypothetical protein